MSKLKSAIIGFGSIAQTHVEALKEGNVSKVVAVCDINPDKLESVKEACPGAKAYTNYAKLLDDRLADVIHICTPHYLHMPITVKALQTGHDVYLEKPAGMNTAEIERIIDESEKYGRKVCVSFQNRVIPSNWAAKCILESSELGAINYGVEGLTWEWGDDNLPHFTDFYLNNDEYQVADMRTIYTDSNERGGYYMWIRENESYPKEVIDGQFKWMDSSLGDWVMPPVTLTSDEAEEYSRYYSDIKTFVDEYTLGVIMGNRTTDDWDNFVAELKNLNVERCIELYQNALNRYNAR